MERQNRKLVHKREIKICHTCLNLSQMRYQKNERLYPSACRKIRYYEGLQIYIYIYHKGRATYHPCIGNGQNYHEWILKLFFAWEI